MIGRRGVLALSVTAVLAGAGAAQLLPGAAPVARAAGLSPYRDCEALLTHYRQEVWASATPYGFGFGNGFAVDSVALADGAASGDVAARSSAEAGSSAPGAAVGQGATGTNLQEQGVDEPDLAKLADGRLVVLAQNAIQVLSAQDEPELLGIPPGSGGGARRTAVSCCSSATAPSSSCPATASARSPTCRTSTSPGGPSGCPRTSPAHPRRAWCWSTCRPTSRACWRTRRTTGST